MLFFFFSKDQKECLIVDIELISNTPRTFFSVILKLDALSVIVLASLFIQSPVSDVVVLASLNLLR